MQTPLLTTPAEQDSVLAEWRELQTRCGHAFATAPALFIAWRDTLGKESPWQPIIATVRREGRLTGLWPLAIVRKKGFRILKGLPNALYFQTDLLAEDEETLHALWQQVKHGTFYDVAWFEDVSGSSPLAPLLAPGSVVPRRTKSYVADLSCGDAETWLAGRSNKMRGNLRRAEVNMAKTAPVTFTLHRDFNEAEVHAFIARKIEWAKEQGLTESYLMAPEATAFLTRFAHQATADGALAFGTLACGETTVAWNLCYLVGKRIYCVAMAHDPAWSKYSPGSMVWLKTILWGIGEGYTAYDMMPHGGFQKESFASETPPIADYRYVRTLRGYALEALFRLREKIKRLHNPLP